MPNFDLARFVAAQSDAYKYALNEVRAGKKRTHWMWFIFPQIKGLGTSETSIYYAIANIAEARAYLAHEILGPRLKEITAAMNEAPGDDAEAILGSVDAAKFRSSMTLFHRADPEEHVFSFALRKFFEGECDGRTIQLLGELAEGTNE